jgi:hypothetical protein
MGSFTLQLVIASLKLGLQEGQLHLASPAAAPRLIRNQLQTKKATEAKHKAQDDMAAALCDQVL